MHCRFSARQLTPPTRRIAGSDGRHHGCVAFPTKKTPLHGQLRMQTSLPNAMRHACSARRLITERSMVRSRWTRTKSGCANGVPKMFRPCKCVGNQRPLHTCADWSTTLTVLSTISLSGSSTPARFQIFVWNADPAIAHNAFSNRPDQLHHQLSHASNSLRIKNRKSLSCDVRRRYIG